MTIPSPIPVIVAGPSHLGGVLTWTLRLKEAFAHHPRYRVMLMEVGPTVIQRDEFDFRVPDYTGAIEILENLPEAIVVPNYIWPLHTICAELAAEGRKMRSIGMCHAHHVEQYHLPLCWYEPVIDQFIAVSRECERHLALCIPDRAADINMLQYGVPVPPKLERSYSVSPIRLVYAGRMVQLQKRVLDFVPLVQELLRLRVDFTLDMVGDGTDLAALRQAMDGTSHGGRVRFVPAVQPDEMEDVWRNHDIFVQVSDFEGTSVSMLESIAQGVVPVQTDAGSGIREVIAEAESGFVVPVGDMKGMAAAVAAAAADRDRLSRMGAAAHRAAGRFSMEKHAEGFACVLDRAWAGPARSWPWRHPMFYPRSRNDAVLVALKAERNLALRDAARYRESLEHVLNKPPVRAYRALKSFLAAVAGGRKRGAGGSPGDKS